MHSYEEGNGTADRPAMNSPTRVCAQDISQRIATPEISTTHVGLEATNASYSMSSVPEAHPMAAPRDSIPTLFTEVQSRHGQKRHLDDTEEEATAEPLHKRPRAEDVRQADKGTTAQERTSGTRGMEVDAVKDAMTEQILRVVRKVYQSGTLEDRFRYQERDNLNTGVVKSSQDGTAEAQRRGQSAGVERSNIAPPNVTAKSSGILQNRHSSRPNLGSLKKKVRFEDEIPDRVPEDLACRGNEFNEAQDHILSATQREVLEQQADDADVIMVDVEDALSVLSLMQARPAQ